MKKKIGWIMVFCLLAQWGMAQAPKWVDKAKRAVFSVVTYDDNDKILNTGNGFFVTEDGVALSDYALFKGARRAVIVNADGEQMPVESIMGANDMYDVVKFKVGISQKKVPALVLAVTAPAEGDNVYLLPYSTKKERICTQGKVNVVDKIDGKYAYLTLDMRLQDKMVSCPVVTTDGEVFGLAQKSSGQDTATVCYAVDANFAMNQSITAFSYGDMSLKGIGIKKALPDTEEQALVFLYMASSQLPADKYKNVLDDFVMQYPNSQDGYLRRASHQILLSQDESSMLQVEADLQKALDVAVAKDDVYYNRAKLIYSYQLSNPDIQFKDWTYDKALEEVRKASAIKDLPVYTLLEGEILFAKQDYAAALQCYDKVNSTSLASAATFFSAAKTKQAMDASSDEVLALMDSCMSRFTEPYMAEAAPYLFERAQVRMNANQARLAMLDYDAYYKAVNGNVNDLFYYYREQAALKAKQFQRALDDIAKAVELNPKDLTYRAEQALVNIRVGRNEEAIKTLQQALNIDANYAEAYRLMGIARIQMKDKKEALKLFTKAKELGDEYVDALIEKYCK